jgi:ABC-type lipoprotein release transport system permease subunit
MLIAAYAIGITLAVYGVLFVRSIMRAMRDEIDALTAQRISKGEILPPPPAIPRELIKNRAQRRAEASRQRG